MRWNTMTAAMTAALAALVLGGCADTQVYSDRHLSQRTNVRYYYAARPVMIVKKTDSKHQPVEVGIAHLPDTSRPHRIVHKQGMGESSWTLTCSNGVATGFTQSSNSMVPENLESLASAGVAYLAGREALGQLDIIKD